MLKEKILVIGASGQIGVELTLALRKMYGNANVVASDLREENDLLKGTGPYVSLDVMNKEMLHVQVIRQNITQIYLLAAILSATGEKNPNLAWSLNMQSLLNVLDIAKEEKLHKVYWPSSIAVFGPTSPKARRSAWLRRSEGQRAICWTKRSRFPANSARDASSKPGRSPAIADMKR